MISIISTILSILAGISTLIVCLVIWQIFNLRLRFPHTEIRSSHDIPDDVKTLLSKGGEKLTEFGFEFSHYHQTHTIIDTGDKTSWGAVYIHYHHKCYASIENCLESGTSLPYAYSFTSAYNDNSWLVTFDSLAYSFPCEIPSVQIVDPYCNDLTIQWKSHQKAMQQITAKAELLKTDAYVKKSDDLLNNYMQHLIDSRQIKKYGAQYQYRLIPGIRFAFKLLKGELTKFRNRKKISETSVTADINNYHTKLASIEQSKPGLKVKTLLFLASAIVFVFSFGLLTFSWQSIAIIFGVILLHELGHILAMALFGYRDLQILFIPFLGAIASSKENNPKAWQQVVVDLMGPVPGIVLGYVLLYLYTINADALIFEIALMLLIINYFNLIPIMPLDGGQMLNLVLFHRFPRVQVFFMGSSGLLLMLIGIYFEDAILLSLACLIVLLTFSKWKHANLLIKLRKNLDQATIDNQKLLTAIFTLINQVNTGKHSFADKFTQASALAQEYQRKAPGFMVCVFSIVFYLGMFTLPPYLLLNTDSADLLSSLVPSTIDNTTDTVPDWQTRLANAENDQTRWDIHMQAADWFLVYQDDLKAEHHLQEASQIAQGFGDNDVRLAKTLYQQGLYAENLETSQQMLKHALSILTQTSSPDLSEQSDILEALASRTNNPQEKISVLKKAIEIRKEIETHGQAGQTEPIINNLIDLASAYQQDQNIASAELYLKTALTEAGDNSFISSLVLTHLSEFYLLNDQYQQAITLLTTHLLSLDKARSGSQSFLDINEIDLNYQIEYARNNLAWACMLADDVICAKRYFKKSDEKTFFSGLNSLFHSQWQLPDLLGLAVLHTRQGDIALAKKYLSKADKFMQENRYFLKNYLERLKSITDTKTPGFNNWVLKKSRIELETLGPIIEKHLESA